MRSLEDLARGILQEHATTQTIADLTACLNHGNGAMRLGDTRRGLMVLGNPAHVMEPGDPKFVPTIMSFRAPQTPPAGSVGGTNFVGHHWRDIAAGLGERRPEGGYKPWAPVATRTTARVPIGGSPGIIRATTPDVRDPDNVYEWHDLTVIPVGVVVFRGATDGHITAFQRLTSIGHEQNLWVKLQGRGRSQGNYGNTYQLVQNFPFGSVERDPNMRRPLAFDPAPLIEARKARSAANSPRRPR